MKGKKKTKEDYLPFQQCKINSFKFKIKKKKSGFIKFSCTNNFPKLNNVFFLKLNNVLQY